MFRDDAFFVIAGPCVLEDDALNLRVGEHLAKLAERIPGGIIYKASFDKANRSTAGGHRGPGLDDGLHKLERVKKETGLPVLTDVHLPDQCQIVAEVADVLQIPAFLCRQTDLLEAAGATQRAVNVKKGQWMHPEGMKGAVDKVQEGGRRKEEEGRRMEDAGRRMEVGGLTKEAGSASFLLSPSSFLLPEVAVTERGTFFGYGDLVVDMRDFKRMRDACGVPVIFDATHSVQRPGQGLGGSSGGAREFIPALALSAIAAGADGLFLETHPHPDQAPSDGPNMIHLQDVAALLDKALQVWRATRT